MTNNLYIKQFVDNTASLTTPDAIVWLDGTTAQRDLLRAEAVASGVLHPFDQEKMPGCFLHRTHPSDVARAEGCTYICTQEKETAGKLNLWCAPGEMHARMDTLLRGGMRGRTMYVIPYAMGAIGSPYAKIGVELTDSIYVALNMLIMTRVGREVLEALGDSPDFVRGVHATLDCDPTQRYICHFPEEGSIISVNTAYGGNALLGKKCFALRLASYMARKEGWMAEHMLILGVETPEGENYYIAAAFPSACGKTNLAMLLPPARFLRQGYRVYLVGDDIAWLHIGKDGRLWAINPENGFFGVAPGTSNKTNPIAMTTIQRDTIYTNTARNPLDNTPWWEGLSPPPASLEDWQGERMTRAEYDKRRAEGARAAHPNSRFTAPITNCPTLSPHWDSPEGVPISAILFGGRRSRVSPLVYEARNWQHGTFIGSAMASETTAAAMGEQGIVRRDPMAMRPFLGYDMGDYWEHWLAMGRRLSHPPHIFHVNWFRTDTAGRYLWPGFGENFRVLLWILDRIRGLCDVEESPIGGLPYSADLNLEGLDELSEEDVEALLSVEVEAYREEVRGIRAFYQEIGSRVPKALWRALEHLEAQLAK